MAHLVTQTCVVDSEVVTAVEKRSDLVLVVVEVDVDAPHPVAGVEDGSLEVDIDTGVGHGCDVARTAGETCGEAVGDVHEHVGGLLVIDVDLASEFLEDAE